MVGFDFSFIDDFIGQAFIVVRIIIVSLPEFQLLDGRF